MEQHQKGFEQRVKQSLDQYEVPYNSADWAQMDRALSSGVRGWGHGKSIIAGAVIVGALLIGGTAYFLGRDTATEKKAQPVAAVVGSTHLNAPTQQAEIVSPVAAKQNTADIKEVEKVDRSSSTSKAIAKRSVATEERSVKAQTSAAPQGTEQPAESGFLFHASAKEACPGSPVDFTVEHMPDDGIYLWNFGDGSFSNKPNPEHTYTKSGRYEVMLSLSSAGAGSIHNKPSSGVIVVHDGPTAEFNMAQIDELGKIPAVRFQNNSKSADSYLWTFGDGTTSTSPQPDHIFKKKGDYRIELTATSASGCVDRSMKDMHIDRDHDLGAPERFTPNNDGTADTFMPNALIQLKTKFQLTIYDKAGVLVYITTDADQPWNGRSRDQGSVCAAGDYVWVVDVQAGTQPAETFTGQVRLER